MCEYDEKVALEIAINLLNNYVPKEDENSDFDKGMKILQDVLKAKKKGEGHGG